MRGLFEISCDRREDGVTAIGRQAISAPWHLSKPYWDGHVLLVQAVNATAGIFSGDHLSLNVEVTEGAAVLLTSPSASRIHTMPHGEASLNQSIRVAMDAWLEWMPELFIPHRNCRYRQTTEIHLDRQASGYMVETLAPGRVEHGEAFAFDSLSWSTKIWMDQKLVLTERYPMTPDNGSLRDLMAGNKTRYFANAFLICPGELPFRDWQRHVMEWNDPSISIGGTQLAENFYLFRMLADTSEQLKETLARLRSLLATNIAPLRQSARKL
jgi:urease accessory protein